MPELFRIHVLCPASVTDSCKDLCEYRDCHCRYVRSRRKYIASKLNLPRCCSGVFFCLCMVSWHNALEKRIRLTYASNSCHLWPPFEWCALVWVTLFKWQCQAGTAFGQGMWFHAWVRRSLFTTVISHCSRLGSWGFAVCFAKAKQLPAACRAYSTA